MQTARADKHPVDDTGTEVSPRTLFDSGSQRSYISNKVRTMLQLKSIRLEKVLIKTFGQNKDSRVQRLDVVQFKIKNKPDCKFTFVEALCVPNICNPLTNQHILQTHKLEKFKDLEFADYEGELGNLRVGVLIGIDYYLTFMTGKAVHSMAGPVACGTKVGWVISGRIGANSSDLHCFETNLLRTSVENRETTDTLQENLENFWSVETISSPSDCVVSQFKKNIVHDGTRYVARLPFKPDHEPLTDNFNVSGRRLKSLKPKLKSKGILHDYDAIFKEYEENGMIEWVPLEKIGKDVGEVHYLPHRPVIREDEQTTKIRAVFDASCKVNGPLLNECLYAGPNLLARIFDILLRFGLNKIGLFADIRQAFLNVAIAREHVDYVRFLWYDLDSNDDKVIIYRFLRVIFGLTISPFLLNGTMRHHLNKYIESERTVVKRIKDDLYVNDLVSGGDSVDTTKKLYDRSKAIMSEAGFDLRK